MYRLALDGLITQGKASALTLVAEAHTIARGLTMIGKFWAYLTLIASEGQHADDGRRRAPLDTTAVTPEWLTLEQCQEAERRKRNASTPH